MIAIMNHDMNIDDKLIIIKVVSKYNYIKSKQGKLITSQTPKSKNLIFQL